MGSEMWRIDEKDVPVMEAVLRLSGFDFDAPDVARALAHVHPIILPTSVVETLPESEQAAYWHEVGVLQSPRWRHPAYVDVEVPDRFKR
jgi:hypothetical protein